jgi:hypothetical protein
LWFIGAIIMHVNKLVYKGGWLCTYIDIKGISNITLNKIEF